MISVQQAKEKVKHLLQKHEVYDGILVIECPFSHCNAYYEVCNTDADILGEFNRRKVRAAIQPYPDAGQEEFIANRAALIGFILAAKTLSKVQPSKTPAQWQIELLTQAVEQMRTMSEDELIEFINQSLSMEVFG